MQASDFIPSLGFRRRLKALRSLPLAALLGLTVVSQSGFAGEVVNFPTSETLGAIVINTRARKLYFILDGKAAIRYPIAVPKRGREWSGRATVTEKLVNPDWMPPPPVRADHPDLPDVVPAGAPNNPVGARAILLDRGPVAIHGTSRRTRRSIGAAASYGCIRMLDEDVIDLFDRVRIGTPVLKIP